ncbi:PilZ domain-containing protein [Dongia mobilis]|uniref:PilZ domain-containing protein n=1 Tax=Dongia sp. TaxID=1977262 RepID=UPI0026F16C67
MAADSSTDHRRHRRFDFGGTAMLVFDDQDHRRTLAITNYQNISQGGACIMTPDVKGFNMGDRMYLMPERYRRKREAVVVNLGKGRLHLEIPRTQALSEFEVAEILEELNRVNKVG